MRKPLELPPDVAKAFMRDMRAFFAEQDKTKADEIAARQLHSLKQHYAGKLRLSEVKQMFRQMRGASIVAGNGPPLSLVWGD